MEETNEKDIIDYNEIIECNPNEVDTKDIIDYNEFLFNIENELLKLRAEIDDLKRIIIMKDSRIKELEDCILSENMSNSSNILEEPNHEHELEPEKETEKELEPEQQKILLENGFINYYSKNKDKIFKNLKNVMIKKGLYIYPTRIPDNILNTYTYKLYNSLSEAEKNNYKTST
jgi:hypothetical protein